MSEATVEIRARHRSFGGELLFCAHRSAVCDGGMRFAVYLPPAASNGPVPVLFWLSGLTCSEENFIAKAGAQAHAARLGMALVVPDTSPRDTGIPGENDSWDLGSGAGFYVDATAEPWARHYQMQSYVNEELPALVAEAFPIDTGRASISGHSMGGHGALVSALRHPDRYVSVSAFSPICSPLNCPWGEKALGAYLGARGEAWQTYDACALIAAADQAGELLVDQGSDDEFLSTQLKPDLLEAACRDAGWSLTLRRQAGYDHSYYFVASFIGEHMDWHAQRLGCVTT